MKLGISDWIRDTRMFAVSQLFNNGKTEISVNDLFQAIMEGRLPAPPSKAGLKKRGSAMCMVFQGAAYFKPTGNMVPGINPASKGRKVGTWELYPVGLPMFENRTRAFMDEATAW